MIRFFYGLLQLMRPLEWTKSFGNMLIAAITAHYFLGVELDAARFLIGFAAVALLWGGLYTLNDYTDRREDALHPVKRKRAIPSGAVPASIAFLFAIALIAISFGIAYYLNGMYLFMLCMFAMFLNQWLYTTKPFKLKKRPILDLISGSLVNPTFRFYAGWVLFVPAFNAPLLALLFILGIQFGGFGLYRMSSKEHEKGLGMDSTVVRYNERKLRRLAYVSLGIGSLSYIIASLTILPLPYLFLGFAMLLPLPLYKTALKRPQEIDMHRMYWIIYIHYMSFIAGFLALSYFF